MKKLILTIFLTSILKVYAGVSYSQKYQKMDQNGTILTEWNIVMLEDGITKINSHTYMYAYEATPTNKDYFRVRGLNLLDINKNKAIECMTISDSPYLPFSVGKCSLNNHSRLQLDDTFNMNAMLKKIINHQCILETDLPKLRIKNYNCNT